MTKDECLSELRALINIKTHIFELKYFLIPDPDNNKEDLWFLDFKEIIKKEMLSIIEATFIIKNPIKGKTPIGILALSLETHNILSVEGIDSIENLLMYSEEGLLKIKTLTVKRFHEIIRKLKDRGLSLKND